MATVFRSYRRYRIAVNSNDHLPAHVHAYGPRLEARYKLNCPEGPVEYWDHEGRWALRHLQEFGEEIAARLNECCEMWNDIHG